MPPKKIRIPKKPPIFRKIERKEIKINITRISSKNRFDLLENKKRDDRRGIQQARDLWRRLKNTRDIKIYRIGIVQFDIEKKDTIALRYREISTKIIADRIGFRLNNFRFTLWQDNILEEPDNEPIIEFEPLNWDTKKMSDKYTPTNLNKVIYNVISYIPPDYLYVVLFKDNKFLPTDFRLFTNTTDLNCAIELIRPYTKKPEILDMIADNIKEEGEGFQKKHCDLIQKKLKLRIRIHTNIGVWYDTDPTDTKKYKSIKIYAHNNHAETLKPLSNPLSVEYVDNFDTSNMNLHKLYIKQNEESSEGINFNIIGIHTENKIIKRYKPPSDSKDYYYCFNEESYDFKAWKIKNSLNPISSSFYEFIKCADCHLTNQYLKNDNIISCLYYHYDINKAYRSYETSPYYSKYKLPLGCYNMFKTNNKDLLNYTGWSRIQNVNIRNPTLKRMKVIQNNCVYTNLRLQFMLGYAEFDIDLIVLSNRNEKLNLPFGDNKFYNNKLIGKLIQSGEERVDYYYSNDINEINQIIFNAEKDPDYISYAPMLTDNLISVKYKRVDYKKQLYNIHSYILDYSNLRMFEQLAKFGDSVILYNVDGFYSDKKLPIDTHQTEYGSFKLEMKKININSTIDATTHTQYNFKGQPIADIPEYKEYENIAHDRFNLTYGPAGAGKSFRFLNTPLINSIMLCPTNKLKNRHQQYTKINCMTYHKFFNFGVKFKRTYEGTNIILDEITMISREVLEKIFHICKEKDYNLYLLGDIDKNGIHQLDVQNGTNLKWSDFIGVKKEKIIGDKRRQNKEDSIIIDNLRNKTNIEIIESNIIKIISENELKILFDGNSEGISCRHYLNHYYNSIICKKFKTWRVRIIRNCKEGKKGEFKRIVPKKSIYLDRKRFDDKPPKGKKYEIAFFNTIDIRQGDTVNNKLFIDITEINKKNYLYTAISRCKKISEVYFVK